MKVYAGAAAAARHYVEADRGRADDYYLAEGTGLARRFTATDGRAVELTPLTGACYEAWVAGRDPITGEPRGRLRTDDRAVRFLEVVVNGPKTWSLAATLHRDIATAYDAAQDRAATQIIGWLSQHATTRVGPRGGQVQVPLQLLEAVTVRHYTSRANDPHRHLHLQVNARVFAAGKWRGLHTVGVRDFLAAINGIGHAAMACDPTLNEAFAAHGYTKNTTGELRELADYVGPMSARAGQIERAMDRYEREWTAAHPGERPGPALRRRWHTRAWAEDRPDKVTPQPGTDLDEGWRTELADLGYRPPTAPVDLSPTPVGALDRDELVEQALSRLAAARSGWNAADIRGEVERLIAAAGIVADPAVRTELAEDLTARAVGGCVPLLDDQALPEHLRVWTSPSVLAVEAELSTRLAARAAITPPDIEPAPLVQLAALGGLDTGQAAAAATLAGTRPLVVVEGAAGVGKTTTLAAARRLLEQGGHRLVVVTPTLKAARVAAGELGTGATSAAWLVHQHGWRWNDDGAWTRLLFGETDPVTGRTYTGPTMSARLRPGDLLVVDEAGMLDQDTARALLTVADECQVRLGLLGDRHQLTAVGRGGVLDLAIDQAAADTHLTLHAVHRFTRTDPAGHTTPDPEYADLTLAMRTGQDPAAVFDALLARGRIRLHPDPAALREAMAATVVGAHARSERVALVVDTHEQAAALSAAIRDGLVAGGQVDDTRGVTTRAGERIGAGDRIATRRNDRDLDVANRDTWIVTAVGPRGELVVTPAQEAPGDVTPAPRGVTPVPCTVTPGPGPVTRSEAHPDEPARGVVPAEPGRRTLPADYVTEHVQLAYASTAHGAQGDTVTAAHLVIGEHTGAAAAYVGMTRGRETNTAHLVAANPEEAREQWIAVFARDRADLGPAHAARLAAAEAARYAAGRPLEQLLADLHTAWAAEQDCLEQLAVWEPHRDTLRQVVALDADHAGELTRLEAAHRSTADAAQRARERAEAGARDLSAEAERSRDALLTAWHEDRELARAAADVLLTGPGRFGQRRAAVAGARDELAGWADRWRPLLSRLPTDPTQLAHLARWFDDRPALVAAFDAASRHAARQRHPEQAGLRAAADAATRAHEQAASALADFQRRRRERLQPLGLIAWATNPDKLLADLQHDLAATRQQLTDTRARLATLTAEPAVLALPAGRLDGERAAWRAGRDAARRIEEHRRAAGRDGHRPAPEVHPRYGARHPSGHEVPR